MTPARSETCDDAPIGAAPAQRPRDPESGLRLFQALRRSIVHGDIPGGSALPEQRLALDHGVSRQRVREVLAMLEERGLVERHPNRGAVVRRATLEELQKLFEVREALEGMCARLAALHAAPESWQPLVELFGAPTEALVESGDMEGYLANHERLRARILEEARNPAMVATLAPLYDRTAVVMRRLVLATNRSQEALEEHRMVLAALRQGDAELAEQLKRKQLRGARQALERYHAFIL